MTRMSHLKIAYRMIHELCSVIHENGKGKVIPLQARCGPEGGYRYSSTLP